MLDVLFVGFISACFTNFFDDIIQEGMILEKYGKFIENKPIGLEDICNTGYIRYLNDTKISNVKSYSCTRSIGMATDLVLVILHNKININNTALRLTSLLLK